MSSFLINKKIDTSKGLGFSLFSSSFQGLLFKFQQVHINIAIKKTMTKEQRKSVINFLEKKQSILEMMENPKCGESMHKTLEIKLQKYGDKIKELICATP